MSNKLLIEEEKVKNIRKLFGDNQTVVLTLKLEFIMANNWKEKDVYDKIKNFFSQKNIKISENSEYRIKNNEIKIEELDKNNDYIKLSCSIDTKLKDLFENVNQINENIEEVKILTLFGDYKI